MPNDAMLNSGCTRERSDTDGGVPTKRILVGLFSRVEKMMKGTPEAVPTLSGEIKTLLQNRYVTMA